MVVAELIPRLDPSPATREDTPAAPPQEPQAPQQTKPAEQGNLHQPVQELHQPGAAEQAHQHQRPGFHPRHQRPKKPAQLVQGRLQPERDFRQLIRHGAKPSDPTGRRRVPSRPLASLSCGRFTPTNPCTATRPDPSSILITSNRPLPADRFGTLPSSYTTPPEKPRADFSSLSPRVEKRRRTRCAPTAPQDRVSRRPPFGRAALPAPTSTRHSLPFSAGAGLKATVLLAATTFMVSPVLGLRP